MPRDREGALVDALAERLVLRLLGISLAEIQGQTRNGLAIFKAANAGIARFVEVYRAETQAGAAADAAGAGDDVG